MPGAIHELESGNHVFRIIERPGFGFDVVIVSSGPFASVRTEAEAVECARRLVHAHMTPRRRVSCPACGRAVGVNQAGAITFHNPEPSAPGKRQRKCPGAGVKL